MTATGSAAAFELVLADRTRVALDEPLTIGRAAGNGLRLDDPTVSRRHAQITLDRGLLWLQDAGSSHGTWLDGRRITAPVAIGDGARIRLGDQELVVARRRRDSEAGLTVVVPSTVAGAEGVPNRPGLRPGYALKRLAASEGARRWVVRDLRSNGFLRLDDADGRLLELLDGRRSVESLMEGAERQLGPEGPVRLARLLTELADRGLLDGAPPSQPRAGRRDGFLGRALAPREWAWSGAAAFFEDLYAGGGRLLFTPAAMVVLGVVALSGLVAFAYVLVGRYGTPFVVASKVGLGGLVFVVGRLAVAAVHETAHGLAMASYGRRVGRAGLKVVLVFPYAFVDTSEAWFEPRRHRIAISAAGPISDAVLGGVFALACLTLGAGALRDICFQLAVGAYLGALLNLNPFVERDGYHILADVLDEPGLRARARAELARRLRGDRSGPPSRVLVRYAVWGLAWSVVAAGVAIVVSLRYGPALRAMLPDAVVDLGFAGVWAALLAPVAAAVIGPLRARARDAR
jgi:putative peptide zinc metalloprotease protein